MVAQPSKAVVKPTAMSAKHSAAVASSVGSGKEVAHAPASSAPSSAAVPVVAAAVAPKKAGIFGSLFGAKKAPGTPSAAPATPVAPSKEPVAAETTSSSSAPAVAKSLAGAFDISVVETNKSAPVVAAAPAPLIKPAGFTTLQSRAAPTAEARAPTVPATVTPQKSADVFTDKQKMAAVLANYNAVAGQAAVAESPAPIVDLHKAAAAALNKPAPVAGAASVNVIPMVMSPAPKAVLKDITVKIAHQQQQQQQAVAAAAAAKDPSPVKEAQYEIVDRYLIAAIIPHDHHCSLLHHSPTLSLPRESTCDDDNSGTEDEHDLTPEQKAEKKRKEDEKIPAWAKNPMLNAALRKQYGFEGTPAVDPDSIFHEVQTCNLVDIFGGDRNPSSKKG